MRTSTKCGALLLGALVTVLISGCSDSDPEPPTHADLVRLATADAKRYTQDEQCLSRFAWPVETTTERDGTPSWYYDHDLLEAITAVGLARRSVRDIKETVDGAAVVHSHFVYALAERAAPLVRIKTQEHYDGTVSRDRVLCLGRLTYEGNVTPAMIYVQRDTLAGFIFHGSESEEHAAYRENDGTAESRFEYSLAATPTREKFADVMQSVGGRKLKDDDAYLRLYDATFRVRKIRALARDSGHGWENEASAPEDRN
ncbi:hypothetical protein [Burkholderia sp. Ac-20365]|uniref:hypothetical protein n=1 Tax=Burkholderia sp. Ac-20365 TaxID=2703897 RepID=UPI00197B92AF|nr:hypothetical protein [Burkholderia sp. Ac-20365]MBN3761244.1 hypothetical protein [Burkholderia sp. Ac-20365]